jgi:N-acetyl sugar amidotransferase
MKYCARCLYPANHPLGITFDQEGICSGCRIHEEKDFLDWKPRKERLKKLLSEFKTKSGKGYDCIIPVSGARDSYFIVDTIKNEFGMNPLLVTYNKHYNTTLGIRNLAYLRSLIGGDILYQTVAPQTVQKITRNTIRKMGSMYWHCLAGQTVFPVQVAVRFKIPLIIWGAHQGIDQVGMYSHLDEVEMTRRYRKDHDLMGYEAEDLLEGSSDLTFNDVRQLAYPHDKEIEKVGVRGIYLNNFIRWDSKAQHEKMIKKYGYESAAQERTFDTYNDVDSFHYSSLHDTVKFIKWGYGKVSDHASREIRLGRLSRKEAIELAARFQNDSFDPANLKLFLDWVGMQEMEFRNYLDSFRDSKIWEQKSAKWTLRDSVVNTQKIDAKSALSECEFKISASRSSQPYSDRYILVGRGHVEKAQ